MTFRKRYIIILAINSLLSISAMGIIPLFAFQFISPREYLNTGLISSKPFQKELFAHLTEDKDAIKNLPYPQRVSMILTRDKGVVYSSGKYHIRNFDYNTALEGFSRLNNRNFRFRAETFSFKDDYGIFLFEIDRRSIVDNIRVYLVPFTIILLIIFIIIPAIVNFTLLFNIKSSFFKLEEAANRVAKGDYDIDLERKQKDELYSFYQSFNRMGKTLKENRDEKARLLMSISHDLKTPLTSMKGYLEAFNDGLVPKNSEKKYLDIVNDKTMLLEERIKSLIDFAKLETADWIRTFSKIDINQLLNEIAPAFKEDSIIYNREFTYKIDIPEATYIFGDQVLLSRAIENLLENGKRYSDIGGKINLEAKIEDSNLLITVSDNGIGIAQEDLEYIFKPFYKVDKGRNSIGMGMGLYNVKTIVESHKGSIWCESKEGFGSRFIISISLI